MDNYPVVSLPKGTVDYVFTTHVTHQQQFFVQVESQSTMLDEITDKLALCYSDVKSDDKTLHDKKLGSLCAAKFTDDNSWYRAKITGLMNNGLIEVLFVDYGNTDYVSEDRVKTIDPELVRYPVQSYRCSLASVLCPQGFWTPELIIQFEDRVLDKRCQAIFVGQDERNDLYYLQMYDCEGSSVNQLFGASSKVDGQALQNEPHISESFKEVSLELGTKFQATVVNLNNPGLFWCQNTAYASDILILSEELSRLHMTQEIRPLKNVCSGTVCAAKFSEDDAWYRGIVHSVSGSKAQVYFVDYGNTESVSLDVVCNLKSEMRKLPVLAIKCCLANISPRGGEWRQELTESFEELAVDKEFEVKVVGKEGDVYRVNLLDIVENRDVGSQLQQVMDNLKANASVRDVTCNKLEPAVTSGVGPSLQVGSKVSVTVSWIESPGDFWVQLSNSKELLEQLFQQLQEAYGQQQPLARPSPGGFVVARYSQDGMWYRGLVLKHLEDGRVHVLFVDYGNSDVVLETELRQVTATFGQVVPLSFRCSLAGVKPLHKCDRSWTTDARDFLEKLTDNGCQCEVLKETDSHRLVRLDVGGDDVAKQLLDAGVVADATSEPRTQTSSFVEHINIRKFDRFSVIVTHVDSPQSFWCQLCKNIPVLDALSKKLSAFYSSDGMSCLRTPVLGQACVAWHTKDNMYYRATLKNVSASGYTVHFVDHGGQDLVPANCVYAADTRFLDLPTQACHCRLPLAGAVNSFTDVMKEAVLGKELDMQVLDVLSEVAIVELFDGKQQISEYLKGTSHTTKQVQRQVDLKPAKHIPAGSTVKAFASTVISPSKFYIQISGVERELELLMDSIAQLYDCDNPPPALTNPCIGQACVALYSEDKQWYRGTVTDMKGNACRVLFVDYGNEEVVEVGNMKVLAPKVAQVPVMAYQCSLDGADAAVWSQLAKQLFESLVMDRELHCTFVTSTSVRISCGDRDVAEQLVSAGHGKAGKAGKAGQYPRQVPASGKKKGFEFNESPRKEQGNMGDSVKRMIERGSSRGFAACDDQNSHKYNGKVGHKDSSAFDGRQRGENGGGYSGGRSGREGARGRDVRYSEGSGRGGGWGDRKSMSDLVIDGDLIYADIPHESESAIVVHMDDNGIFYLQLLSMEKDILMLCKRMAGSYKSGNAGRRLRETPVKGTVCCARFSGDGNMYRARVEDVRGNVAVLRYVDYGNTGECSVRDLKFLFPNLLKIPVQAFPCVLRGYTWSLDQAEKFALATLDKELKVIFTSTTCPFEVDILTADGDLLSFLTGTTAPPPQKLSPKPPSHGLSPKPSSHGLSPKSSGHGLSPKSGSFGNKSTSSGFSNKSNRCEKFNFDARRQTVALNQPLESQVLPKQEFPSVCAPQGVHEAFISHIREDGFFYLQLARDTHILESVSAKLESLPEGVRHPNPAAGSACAAVFSEDSSWYRALVTGRSGDTLSLVFVDYGNGDSVSVGSVRPLSHELLSFAPLALQCQFSNLGPLSCEAQSKLAEYLIEHQVTVTFEGESPPFNVSVKIASGEDLEEIICPLKQFKAQSVPAEVMAAGVSHIEDDGRFFVQLLRDQKALKLLQEMLSSVSQIGSFERIESVEDGMPCCVKLENDLWHRGKLVKTVDKCIHVLLVDSGRTVVTDSASIRTLPCQFLKEPPYALECRLKGVECWTEDLRAKFIHMTQDKILNATFYSKTPPLRVSLARSIELDLLGLSAPPPDSPEKSPVRRPLPAHTVTTYADLKKKTKQDDKSSDDVEEVNRSEPARRDENVLQDGEPGSQTAGQKQGLDVASNQRAAVTVSWVHSPDRFYFQLNDKMADLDKMMDDMADYFSSLPEVCESSEQFVAGDICAALSEDESWYRVRVCSSTEHGAAYHVLYIDYGNTEVAAVTSLRQLPDQFRSLLPWAVEARLVGVRPVGDGWTEEAVQELKIMAESKSLLADILEVSQEHRKCIVQLLDLGVPVHEELVRKGYAVSAGEIALSRNIQHIFEDDNCAKSEESSGYLDAVTKSEESSGYLDAVTKSEESSGYLDTVTKSEESNGYLDSVTKSEESNGYLDTVTKSEEPSDCLVDISKSEDSNGYLDAAATKSEESSDCLVDISKSEDSNGYLDAAATKSEESSDCLVDISKSEDSNGYLDAAATKSEEPSDCLESTRVEEIERINSSNEQMKIKPGGVSSSLEKLQEVRAYVSHLVSPSLFWCQLSSAASTLSEISQAMTAKYRSASSEASQVTELPQVGDVVMAMFHEDEQLYRARVVSVASGQDDQATHKVRVNFMDYGNEIEVSYNEMFKFDDSLSKWPAQAIRCCLDNIQPPQDKWSSEACVKFSEIVTDRELILKFIGQGQDGTHWVQIELEETGQSVHYLMVESGLVSESYTDTQCLLTADTLKDLSEIEFLDMTRPIMESTAMMSDVTDTKTSLFQYEGRGQTSLRSLRLSLHTEYNVSVTNDELPSSFHIQLHELRDQYMSLMAEIADHIVSDACLEFCPSVDELCLVQHCSVWYRGQVTSRESSSWNVKSLDCGWQVNVLSSELRPLPVQFTVMPAQAVPCYLAGVVSMEAEWTTDAITFFMDSVRDTKLCINVLETADDGKYGVYLTDLDNTSCQSVNRAMVDLGYAEVVPGSNIEVQIEMEKTLDTDMLEELEESFNDVSMLKYNVHSDLDIEEGVSCLSDCGEVYEESEICKASKSEMNKKLYQLVQIPELLLTSDDSKPLTDVKSSTDDSKPLTDVKSSTDDSKPLTDVRSSTDDSLTSEFNVASAVERIDKMGCVDNYPEDCLSIMNDELDSTVAEESRCISATIRNDDNGCNHDSCTVMDARHVNVLEHQDVSSGSIICEEGEVKTSLITDNSCPGVSEEDKPRIHEDKHVSASETYPCDGGSVKMLSCSKQTSDVSLESFNKQTSDLPLISCTDRMMDEEKTLGAAADAFHGVEDVIGQAESGDVLQTD